MAQYLTTHPENDDIKNAAFYYSVNMLHTLRTFGLLADDEYERILKISVLHYDIDFIYV